MGASGGLLRGVEPGNPKTVCAGESSVAIGYGDPGPSKGVSEGTQVGTHVRWRKLLFHLVGGKRGTVEERDGPRGTVAAGYPQAHCLGHLKPVKSPYPTVLAGVSTVIRYCLKDHRPALYL